MNIFETQNEFFGHYGWDSMEETLQSLFTLALDIRLQLGRQGYLLDNYLSLFLDAANAVLASEAADFGAEKGRDLRNLCRDITDQQNERKEHPLYNLALNTLNIRMDIQHYLEHQTKLNLLYVSLSDQYLPLVIKQFEKMIDESISDAYDSQKLNDLFNRITIVVGESLMDTLNQKLKQRFLIVPLAMVFAHSITNDLLYCLKSRDNETRKQIFQLLLDSMSENRVGKQTSDKP